MKKIVATNLLILGLFFGALNCAHMNSFGGCEIGAVEQSAKDMVLSALESDSWRDAMAYCVTKLGVDTVDCIVAEILKKKSAKANPDPGDENIVARGHIWLARK